MKYRTYDDKGNLLGAGELDPHCADIRPIFDTCDAVALEVAEGRWLRFSSSEWLLVSLSDSPDDPQRPDAVTVLPPPAPEFNLRENIMQGNGGYDLES